jgi:hypothetical protein
LEWFQACLLFSAAFTGVREKATKISKLKMGAAARRIARIPDLP